jgi:hypothetical protein
MGSEREPGRDSYPGTPLWVKVFAIATAVMLAAVVLFAVVGIAMGLHTPGGPGHMPAESPAHSR